MKLNQFFRNPNFLKSNLYNLKVIKLLFGIVLIIAVSLPVYGQKKLFKAIRKGDVDAVSSYISKGGDLNKSIELWSYDAHYDKDTMNFFFPLEFAALHEQAEVLNLIMQHKESINDYHDHETEMTEILGGHDSYENEIAFLGGDGDSASWFSLFKIEK